MGQAAPRDELSACFIAMLASAAAPRCPNSCPNGVQLEQIESVRFSQLLPSGKHKVSLVPPRHLAVEESS